MVCAKGDNGGEAFEFIYLHEKFFVKGFAEHLFSLVLTNSDMASMTEYSYF